MCKISVVTSVYNCEKYIKETIQSVIDQTYTDWEYIIIDDCSRDNSAKIIQSIQDDRIRFIKNETNQGQCANLNKGIKLARGEYIARLDHDDICYPDRFVKQLKYMEQKRGTSIHILLISFKSPIGMRLRNIFMNREFIQLSDIILSI